LRTLDRVASPAVGTRGGAHSSSDDRVLYIQAYSLTRQSSEHCSCVLHACDEQYSARLPRSPAGGVSGHAIRACPFPDPARPLHHFAISPPLMCSSLFFSLLLPCLAEMRGHVYLSHLDLIRQSYETLSCTVLLAHGLAAFAAHHCGSSG
jgi:hypothetical protein